MEEQAIPRDDLDADNMINALDRNSDDYDWRTFENEFRIFLEQRLNRHHNGSIENPELSDTNLEVNTHYSPGYIHSEVASPEIANVFMTSIIQFEDLEEDDYGIEVEYLDKEEGIEAIKHLLENEQEEKVDTMVRFGLKINPERALEAYKVVAREKPILAKNMLGELPLNDNDLESSMKSIYFKNNPEMFESFRDGLDF